MTLLAAVRMIKPYAVVIRKGSWHYFIGFCPTAVEADKLARKAETGLRASLPKPPTKFPGRSPAVLIYHLFSERPVQ